MTAISLPEWLMSEKDLTLATWGLVLCTFLLFVTTVFTWIDSLNRGKEQRERWKREDEQHKQDRSEERERWKREDELRAVLVKEEILNELFLEFSGREMRSARSVFAYSLFAWNPIVRYTTIGGPVEFKKNEPEQIVRGEQAIADFFTRLARLLEEGEVELSDLDRKFGDYIFNFVTATSYRSSEKLSTTRGLWQRLENYRRSVKIPTPNLDTISRKDYWFNAIESDLLPPTFN